MTTSWRRLRPLGWLLVLMLALTACAGQPQRLWLKAPGWSRAQLVDNTRVGDPVRVAFDNAGHIYLFLVSAGHDAPRLRAVALDGRADVSWDRTFQAIELTRPRKPHILWDGEVLQLFWLSDRALYHVQADAATGSMAAWYAGPRDNPGLYALPSGDLTGEAFLVDAEGMRPDV